jgi:hypothetical protein
MSDVTKSAREAASQPLLYRKPEALNAKIHGALRLLPGSDYSFARQTNSVAITASEFIAVSRNFPIVFAGEEAYPAAVLGLETGNLFVDETGKWAEHAYVPAYVRRYPFAFIAFDEGKQFALGIDRDCPRLVTKNEDGAVALFEEEKPTRLTDDALRFCIAFQNDHGVTVNFTKALKEQNLLVDVQYAASIAAGKYVALKGFQVVDPARFQGLSDAVVLDWHRKGWLAMAQSHLSSQDHWNVLTARHIALLRAAA